MLKNDQSTELLQNLIAIPSVSPEGDAGTDQTGEERIVEHVERLLSRCGAQTQVQEARPGRPNLIASFKPRGNVLRRIVLAPHFDTVSVAGMTIPPFGGQLRDGHIYGRGACDTKGPAAAALSVLMALADEGSLPAQHTEWIFLGLAGEEDGSFGAQALCETGFSADLVVALEPTDNRVVCAHKGALWLKLKTHGRAAHGSAPQQGDNAVYKMARALPALEILAREFSEKIHPVLGGASLNVGRLTGGSRINTVPDYCEALVDIRTHSGFSGNDALAAVRRALPSEVQIEILRNACPLDTDPATPLVNALLERSEGQASAGWFSDASVFAEYGIPAVVFGPGSIRQAHTADEWISAEELGKGAGILRQFILQVNAQDKRL
ncbi:MAG: M20 family metallopeptidase [Verrucomicrobia bacterium]|nr:M20 family metallopeptidase [Verrucomicrobiota bacterium]